MDETAIAWIPGGIGDAIRGAVRATDLVPSVSHAHSGGRPVSVVTTHPDDAAGRMRATAIRRLFEHDPRVVSVTSLTWGESHRLTDQVGMAGLPFDAGSRPFIVALAEALRFRNESVHAVHAVHADGVYPPPEYWAQRDDILQWADGRPVAAIAPFGRGPLSAQDWHDLGLHLANRGWAVVVVGGGDFDRRVPRSLPIVTAIDFLRSKSPTSVVQYEQDDDVFLSIAAADVARACITSDTWTCLGFTLWDRYHALVPSVYPVGGFYSSHQQYLTAITCQSNTDHNLYCLDGEATVGGLLSWCDGLPEGDTEAKLLSSLVQETNNA